jgi:hypothetical protein
MESRAERLVKASRGKASVIGRWQFGLMRYSDDSPVPTGRQAPPLAAARDLAHAIAGTLRMARGFLAAGRCVDLTGLEELVGLLCAKSLDLPPEQGRQMRVVLIDLRRELDAVSAMLRATQGGATLDF